MAELEDIEIHSLNEIEGFIVCCRCCGAILTDDVDMIGLPELLERVAAHVHLSMSG